jgi:phage shock protein A
VTAENIAPVIQIVSPAAGSVHDVLGLGQHVVEDGHEALRLLASLEEQLKGARSQISELSGQVAELLGKVAQLEEEFGPLARKYGGTVARLGATRAASFVRRNSDRSAD